MRSVHILLVLLCTLIVGTAIAQDKTPGLWNISADGTGVISHYDIKACDGSIDAVDIDFDHKTVVVICGVNKVELPASILNKVQVITAGSGPRL